MLNQSGWVRRRSHTRRLPNGRSTLVRESWAPSPAKGDQKRGTYRRACPRCGASIISVNMPNGGWAHFEGAQGLTRVKHPCLHLGERLSRARDGKTGDLFDEPRDHPVVESPRDGTRMAPSHEAVIKAAYAFRAAIDAAGPEPWSTKHIQFPRGACGHAAELLGRHLMNQLGVVADYVCRMAHSDIEGWTGSHAWLEWDGLVIDITGDQFGWPPVIVARDSTPHHRGTDEVRNRVCHENSADWWACECGPLWRAIAPHLKA